MVLDGIGEIHCPDGALIPTGIRFQHYLSITVVIIQVQERSVGILPDVAQMRQFIERFAIIQDVVEPFFEGLVHHNSGRCYCCWRFLAGCGMIHDRDGK